MRLLTLVGIISLSLTLSGCGIFHHGGGGGGQGGGHSQQNDRH